MPYIGKHETFVNHPQWIRLKCNVLKASVIIGLITTGFGTVSGIMLNRPFLIVLVNIFGMLILAVCGAFVFRNKSLKSATWVAIIYFCFINTPLVWVPLNGLGGAVALSIFPFAAIIILLLDGKTMYVMLGLYLGLIAVMTVCELFNMLPLSEQTNYAQYIVTLTTMLSVFLYIVVSFKRSYGMMTSRLLKLSVVDSLTEVFNVRHIETMVTALEKQWRINTVPYAVLLFDLDNFKTLNDRYGHLKGNDVLLAVSRSITKLIRKNDIFGRYGGDEFILLLPDTDKQTAVSIAERIRKHIAGLSYDGIDDKLTLSIGVTARHDVPDNVDLISLTDKRLYKAKSLGKNLVFAD